MTSASRVRDLLDQMTLDGAITGYTIEPDPAYLHAGRPVLSYGMYAFDRLARSNLRRFVRDMSGLGADFSFHRTIGSTRATGRGLHRTDQLTAVAWFRACRGLRSAVRLVSRRYVAGADGAVPGSWIYPDARICGVREAIAATIPAVAHQMRFHSVSVVVLSRSGESPLRGMRSQPLRLLRTWTRILEKTA